MTAPERDETRLHQRLVSRSPPDDVDIKLEAAQAGVSREFLGSLFKMIWSHNGFGV